MVHVGAPQRDGHVPVHRYRGFHTSASSAWRRLRGGSGPSRSAGSSGLCRPCRSRGQYAGGRVPRGVRARQGRGCHRGRGAASAGGRAMARGRRRACADGSAHRRAGGGRGELRGPRGPPGGTNLRAGAWWPDSRVERDARAARRRSVTGDLVQGSRRAAAEGLRSARAPVSGCRRRPASGFPASDLGCRFTGWAGRRRPWPAAAAEPDRRPHGRCSRDRRPRPCLCRSAAYAHGPGRGRQDALGG
jgi:hypothetical protein